MVLLLLLLIELSVHYGGGGWIETKRNLEHLGVGVETKEALISLSNNSKIVGSRQVAEDWPPSHLSPTAPEELLGERLGRCPWCWSLNLMSSSLSSECGVARGKGRHLS